MLASAQLPAELASGDELERVHFQGEDLGTFWVSGPNILVREEEADFASAYSEALNALFEQDSRVKNGHAFKISIVN